MPSATLPHPRPRIRSAPLALFVAFALACAQTDALAPALGGAHGQPVPGDGDSPATGGEQPPSALLRSFAVTPGTAELTTLAPGNTVQLSVAALDSSGAPLQVTTPVTFATSDSTIATVNSSGVVTGLAPGTVFVTAVLQVKKNEFGSGLMVARVRVPTTVTGDYPDVGGVYDLTATYLRGDDWGPSAGARHVAVVTIEHLPSSSTFTGTFSAFRAIEPDGRSFDWGSGSVRGSVDREERVDLEFSFGQNTAVELLATGMLNANQITGNLLLPWYAASGSVSLVRRQAP